MPETKATIEIPNDYIVNLTERDAFLQACCDIMFNHSMVLTAEALAEFQSEYDLEACQQFFDENYNG